MDKRIYELREKAKAENNPVLRDKSFELLLKTVRERKPQKILEIGVNLGLSSISMLLESENANLTGIEIDEERAKKAKENGKLFGVESRVKIFVGDASKIIPLLTGEYDFIFLDGPKGHYGEYLPQLLSVLKVGGILFADNVLFRGYITGKEKTPHRFMTTKHSLESFIKGITESENLRTEIIDIEDGISITEKIK